jgi:type IV fimbrial biogenesis protein FimT
MRAMGRTGAVRVRRAAGFTLIEAAVVVAIIGILAALGAPSMSDWLLARRVQSAASYYEDGFIAARTQAIAHNAAARLVLNPNATSGQMEWQVDLCYPNSTAPCDDENGSWSTLTTAVTDPSTNTSVKSLTRSAAGLPPAAVMTATLAPNGADETYFKPMGWLDTGVSPQLTRIVLAPSDKRPGAFKPMAIALTLAGVASRCDPSVQSPDPKGCPP